MNNNQVSKPGRRVNKMTIENSADFLQKLESRLLDTCEYYVFLNEIRATTEVEKRELKNVLALIKKLHKTVDNLKTKAVPKEALRYFLNKGLPMVELKVENALSTAQGMIKVGKPEIKPEIGMILYIAVMQAEGNRKLTSQIGLLIKENGKLHKILDEKFGEGTFQSMQFPTISDSEKYWERGSKEYLEKAAMKVGGFFNPLTNKDTMVRAYLEEIVQTGGQTTFEFRKVL